MNRELGFNSSRCIGFSLQYDTQPNLGFHAATSPAGTGSSSCNVNHSSLPSAEVKNGWIFASLPHMYS